MKQRQDQPDEDHSKRGSAAENFEDIRVLSQVWKRGSGRPVVILKLLGKVG